MRIAEITRHAISELTRPVDIPNAAALLARAGYKDLANEPGHVQGTFATVMARPNDPFLLKLFQQDDYAYRRYLNLITSVNNPHFPRIKGKPVKITNDYYAVRLERLTPLASDALSQQAAGAMEQYLIYVGSHPNASRYLKDLPTTAKQALDLIHQYCLKGQSGTSPDLHDDNVMMRGSTIVIIDPVAFGEPTARTPNQSNRPQRVQTPLPSHWAKWVGDEKGTRKSPARTRAGEVQ